MTTYSSEAKFFKLDRASLLKVASRLKGSRPFVRRVWGRTFQVTDSKPGTSYLVEFHGPKRLDLAHCTCPATTVCKHIPAARLLEIGIGKGAAR